MTKLKKNTLVLFLAAFVFLSFTVAPVFAQEVPVADGSGNNTPTIDPNASVDPSTTSQTPPSGSIGGNGEDEPLSSSGDEGDGINGAGSSTSGTPTGLTNPTTPTTPTSPTTPTNPTAPTNPVEPPPVAVYHVVTSSVIINGNIYENSTTYLVMGGVSRPLYETTYFATTYQGPEDDGSVITFTGVEARTKTFHWQTGAVQTDRSTLQLQVGPRGDIGNGWDAGVSGNITIQRNNITGDETGSGFVVFSGVIYTQYTSTPWPDEIGSRMYQLVAEPNNPGHLIWVKMTMQMP